MEIEVCFENVYQGAVEELEESEAPNKQKIITQQITI